MPSRTLWPKHVRHSPPRLAARLLGTSHHVEYSFFDVLVSRICAAGWSRVTAVQPFLLESLPWQCQAYNEFLVPSAFCCSECGLLPGAPSQVWSGPKQRHQTHERGGYLGHWPLLHISEQNHCSRWRVGPEVMEPLALQGHFRFSLRDIGSNLIAQVVDRLPVK